MNVLIIDNFDSFTYNLYQYVGEILQNAAYQQHLADFRVEVVRNDQLDINALADNPPDRIIVSPGPGNPEDETYFGKCKDAILTLGKTTPLLGVCLGMQGIVHAFGGKVVHAPVPMHGKTSPIEHDDKGVFKGIPQHLDIMRYHSLMADEDTLPSCLSISARTQDDGLIMGVRHQTHPIEGIQFHPESFASEGGIDMLKNFLLY